MAPKGPERTVKVRALRAFYYHDYLHDGTWTQKIFLKETGDVFLMRAKDVAENRTTRKIEIYTEAPPNPAPPAPPAPEPEKEPASPAAKKEKEPKQRFH